MNRHPRLPSTADVQETIRRLTAETGRAPTVLGLARHLGLANTTFRRNFPAIADDLHQHRSRTTSAADPGSSAPFDQLQRTNQKLQHSVHELTEHLRLATAVIQRLAMENDQLRRQLAGTATVVPMPPRPHRRGIGLSPSTSRPHQP